jgi:tetratricopeptide (TPR) repeat protein
MSTVGCIPQASPAADLLTEVVKNTKFNTVEVLELLADALFEAGEHNRAAKTFETTASLAKKEGKNAAVADLLDKAGSAWLEARSFVEAGSVYDRLLELSPSRPSAHLGRAKTYRYTNQRLKELQFLLDSLDSLPDAKELEEELGFLASSLLEDEIGPALKILELKKEKPSVALAIQLLTTKVTQLVPLIYIHVTNEEQRGRARKVQKQLQDQGYLVPGIEIKSNAEETTSELRYFHDNETEREDTQKILQILNGLGATVKPIYARPYKGSKSIRSRQYEIWFGPDF